MGKCKHRVTCYCDTHNDKIIKHCDAGLQEAVSEALNNLLNVEAMTIHSILHTRGITLETVEGAMEMTLLYLRQQAGLKMENE